MPTRSIKRPESNTEQVLIGLTNSEAALLKTELGVKKRLILTMPINLTADYDFVEQQYSFYLHSTSYYTTIDDVIYRIIFRTNIVSDKNLTTIAAVYDNFDEVFRYLESCIVTYGDENQFKYGNCIEVKKSAVTSGKYLINAIDFVFEIN